jgi:hypothetical protein
VVNSVADSVQAQTGWRLAHLPKSQGRHEERERRHTRETPRFRSRGVPYPGSAWEWPYQVIGGGDERGVARASCVVRAWVRV